MYVNRASVWEVEVIFPFLPSLTCTVRSAYYLSIYILIHTHTYKYTKVVKEERGET